MTQRGSDSWRLFWAKTDRGGGLRLGDHWTHPLWAHLLDVAHVADELADRLPEASRHELADGLGLTWEQARPLLALLIGLHDAGKAIPSFQAQHTPSADALRQLELGFDVNADLRHHGHASIPILHDWIGASVAEPARPLLKTLAAFVGFHHGRIDKSLEWTCENALGGGAWRAAQRALVQHIADVWMAAHGGWPDLGGAPTTRRGLPFPAASFAFAGWTTLADWVGSMSEHMPPDAADHDELADYLPASRAAARAAIAAAGLDGSAALYAEAGMDDFERCFPETFASPTARPHRLQEIAATIGLPPGPTLALIEAPTGEGKTEAAFHLAARLQAGRSDARGVYVALPTQATSNGLFPRFVRFLEVAHADGDPNVLLAHGASGLNLDLDALVRQPVEPQDEDEADRSRAYAARWFLPSKRSLLAPYGVGTIDQALMGVVTSRHFFLRLYGLAGKTVVFDEVHAYDGYTAALLCRLLEWLRALGSDVVLLTATLPRATRRALLRAWSAPDVPDPDAYPVVAVAAAGRMSGLVAFEGGFGTTQTADAELAFGDSDAGWIVARVTEAVAEGATVGVIVNRVDRAQDVFRQLDGLDADLHLLHARFPFHARDARERAAVARFGKSGRRAATRPAVLVATQVAEQSLDLDVDLMLSDLAPVDLLLQRAGRLHRHPSLDSLRPLGYEQPRLVVLRPPLASDDALPDVSAIGGQFRPENPEGIYLDLPLFRTDLALRPRVASGAGWSLPADYRPLIEAVYGDDADAFPDELAEDERPRWKLAVKARKDLEQLFREKAGLATVEEPSRLGDLLKSGFYADRTRYDEDDDTPARDLKPQTRLGGPSVQAVCLHRRDGHLILDTGDAFPSGPKLTRDETREMLRSAVRLSRASVVRDVPKMTLPGWTSLTKKNPALAYHHPLVFERGRCMVGKTTIELHPELGVRYDPER